MTALSVIVVGFNMSRELPRTIRSLSPALQRDIAADDYEIVVVDNGSASPPTAAQVAAWAPNARLLTMGVPAPVSPVLAINQAVEGTAGRLIGVLIDGARMASPRLLATALDAARLGDRALVGSLAFHLGPDVQMRSVLAGYDQSVEDRLLADLAWEEDPYRLFEVSVFAGSSAEGWFITPSETNAFFLGREHWLRLGGYDLAFQSPGGGLANLDIWKRACASADARVIMLLGEATFHQVHGGIATNARLSPLEAFHDEYVRIRGHAYERPAIAPMLFGRLHKSVAPSLQASAANLARRLGLPPATH